MVSRFTPRSVWGCSQKQSLSTAYSMRTLVPDKSAPVACSSTRTVCGAWSRRARASHTGKRALLALSKYWRGGVGGEGRGGVVGGQPVAIGRLDRGRGLEAGLQAGEQGLQISVQARRGSRGRGVRLRHQKGLLK